MDIRIRVWRPLNLRIWIANMRRRPIVGLTWSRCWNHLVDVPHPFALTGFLFSWFPFPFPLSLALAHPLVVLTFMIRIRWQPTTR